MKRYLLLFLFLAVTFFCFSAKAEGLETPQRIISLGPAITEELYLLGIGDRLVGCTVYCRTPSEAKTKEKVGTVRDVNIEKIVRLKPDLVLTTSVINHNDIEKLKKLRLKTINFSAPRNFLEICDQLLRLGNVTGREKEAADIVKEASSRVSAIEARVGNLPKPKVFVQTGARPLYTANGGSFVHDYIVRAGGINIAAGACGGSDYGTYARERVIKDNPDVILIATMGVVGEEEKTIWKKFRGLNAVGNNRIYIVDADRLCSPTPLSFAEMLGEITVLLHPGAIK